MSVRFKVEQMLGRGVPPPEVARAVGVSRQRVHQIAAAPAVKPAVGPALRRRLALAYATGRTAAAVAATHGVSAGTVIRAARAEGVAVRPPGRRRAADGEV